MSLAKKLGCLFLECSAKTRENVEQSFEELVLKVDNCITIWEKDIRIALELHNTKLVCFINIASRLLIEVSLWSDHGGAKAA